MNLRHPYPFTAALLVATALLAVATGRSAAADPDSTAGGGVSFHRVYAPADRIDEWPRGSVRYVPMDRDAFERTVAEIAAEAKAPANAKTRVERAIYSARLDAAGVLRGSAELTISHTAEQPVLLPLGECNLTLISAAWTHAPTQATLGVGRDGKLHLLIERPGTLRIEFRHRRATELGRSVFRAKFPSGIVTRWLLDSPLDHTPTVEGGHVEVATAESGANEAAASPAESPPDSRRTWRIELGSRNQLALIIDSPESARGRVIATMHVTDYSIAASGVSFTAQYSFDASQEIPSRLTFRLDAEATLVGSELDGKVAKAVGYRGADGGEQSTTIETPPLPAASSTAVRTLTIHAYAPAKLGQRWRLPRIVLENVPWQKSEARIRAAAPLRIAQLWPTHAHLSAAATPDAATLDCLAADASVDAVIDWSPRDIHAACALLLELGGEARGQAVLDAEFPDAARTTLTARIDEHWAVEGVTATPADALVDWRVATDEHGRERLIVEARPNEHEHAHIVAAVRRRESPEQRPMNAAELRAIDWSPSCKVTTDVVSIAAARAYQLTTAGDHRLSLVTESDEAHRLLAGHSSQLKFHLDSTGPRFSVAARRATTPFRGELDVDSYFAGETIRDTFRLRCTPQSDGLAQVVVRVSPPSDETIAWSDAVNADEPVSARRLSDSELRAFLMEPGSEAWRFTFVPTRSTPFAIVGQRTRRFGDSAPVALAEFVNAAAQTGSLTLRSSADTRIAIDNRRLTAIPPRDEPLSALSEVRGVYRFVPSRDAATMETAVVSRAKHLPDAGAVAYACRLTVRLHPDGKTIWNVAYDLESFGQQQVALSLPESVTRFDAIVDGQIANGGPHARSPIRLALPKNRRFVNVVVSFETAEDALSFFVRRSLQAPEIDVPVLQRRWNVSLPSEFAVGSPVRGGARELSWSERLFGPLGRSADEPPTSPIPWIDRSESRPDAATARGAVERLLETLGTARKSASTSSTASWSHLLGQIDDERFYVDAAALDRAGIAPWTPLPPARESERAAAARLLLESKLAIVSDGNRVLLTTATAATSFPDAESLGIEPRNDLGRSILYLPRSTTARGAIPVRAWSQASAASLPWLAHEGDETWHGWRQVELAGDGDAITLEIVHVRKSRTFAWILFLVSAALAWRFCRYSAAIWITLAATAIVALLIGERHIHFAPMLWGVWWGLCVGALVAKLPRQRRRANRVAPSHSAASRGAKHAATVASFLLVALGVVRSSAQDGQPVAGAKPATPPKAQIHRVFFPVDDESKPVGARVYVPEALFTRLERWNLDRDRGPRGALFTSASHQVRLDWNGDNTSLEPTSATAIVEIVTFDDDAEIRLPISVAEPQAAAESGESEPQSPSIRLDGALLEASEISIEKDIAIFHIAKAGAHRVEVPLPPSASDIEGGIAIKPIAAGLTKLEISAPENSPEVEIVSVSDAAILARGRGMLTSPIVPTASYAIRWTKATGRPADGRLESAERLRIDVRPTIATFTAEVLLTTTTSLPEELRVAADPRLVPIAATVDGKKTTWRRTGAADDQLAFRLSAPGAREATLEATFVLRDAVGIGTFRLPRWEPAVAEVRRRWLAVNIDESLEHEIFVGPETLLMAVADFVQDESEDLLPDYAYRLPTGSINWSLTTRRKSNRVRVDQSLAVTGEPHRALVALDAEITVAAGDVYDHVVRCDERLRVDRVTVTENGANRVAYWTQAPDGVVQIFLNERAGAQQRLRLEGHVPATEDGKVQVADVVLDGAERTRAHSKLYRLPSVRLTVESVAGYVDAQASAGESSGAPPNDPNRAAMPPQPRLLRELAASGDAAPVVSLRLESNTPKVDATSVVTVDEIGAEAWSVRGEFRGTVTDGVLDEVMLDLPGDWTGEAVVDPPMPATVSATPDGGRRLTVRPVLPLRRAFALSVTGRIRPPSSRAVPRWKILDADTQHEFCSLPTLWAGRFLGWDLTEMRRASPGEGFALSVRESARFETYQLVGDRASAVLQAEVPRVRSLEADVDIVAAPLDEDSQCVVATYDLIPSGVGACRITMPEGGRLIAAILDDRRQTPHRAGKNEWRIDLHSDSLPQQLALMAIVPTRGGSSGSQTWSAPQLLDATIRRTIWSIPADTIPANAPKEGESSDDAVSIASVRVEALAELCAAAAASSSEHKSLAVRRWQRRLSAALPPADASSAAFTSSYVVAGDSSAAGTPNTQTLVRQFGATQLGQFGKDTVFELPAAQARRFADQFLRDGGPTARAMVVASPPEILDAAALLRRGGDVAFREVVTADGAWTLETKRVASQGWSWNRWLLAIAIAAASLALARPAVRRRVSQGHAQRPYLALAVAGVAWWLWLAPSWFGWVLIALALIFAWRLAWSLPRVDPRIRSASGA
jgi:hypothetical protein